MKKMLAVLMFTCLSAAVFADGGGGMFLGMQTARYPFLDEYPVYNNSLGLSYYGGFGYGISDRIITGGFGYTLMDTTGETGIAAGFGGVISGIRLTRGPIQISILSWTALGGIYTGNYDTGQGSGFFCLSEELTLDIGLPLISWFMPSVYVGYQVAANIIPGSPFSTFFSYTPVVGIRLAWGHFH